MCILIVDIIIDFYCICDVDFSYLLKAFGDFNQGIKI